MLGGGRSVVYNTPHKYGNVLVFDYVLTTHVRTDDVCIIFAQIAHLLLDLCSGLRGFGL